MKRGRPARIVELSEEEVTKLQVVVKRGKSAQRDVVRAKIVLMAHEGMTTTEIARRLRVSPGMVCKWRKQVAEHGCAGLVDKPRSGRPRVFSTATRLEIVALACEPAETGPGDRSTLDDLVVRAVERGVVPTISRSHVHRILMDGDIRPHRVKMWLHSNDPEFREKVNVICGLYEVAEQNSVVLCVDEKTGIQAVERKYPDNPPAPGRVRRREYEYIRHGTQALLAAFEVRTGRVVAECRNRRTQADLLEFMERVAESYPGVKVHVIWDNLNTHRAYEKAWKPFNQRHGGRFQFHFTPIHASWVNQVELWFGIYTRRVLKNASFNSTECLREATEAFCRSWNENSKPFAWTFRGFHLQTGEAIRR